jgi:Holliday junction resolvase RusA-like endonuclease
MRIDKGLEADRDTTWRFVFTVYGIANAQSRAGRFHYIAGGRAQSRAYDPKKSSNWKDDVKTQVLAQLETSTRGKMLSALHAGPVVLDLFFYLPRPKTYAKKKRHHIRKPDRDNLEKGVKDALKGIIWKDDSQVCDGRTRKMYGDPPRVVIAVRLITHGDELDDLPMLVPLATGGERR